MKKLSIIGLIVLVLDQLTKYIVMSTMTKGQSIVIIKDFFALTSHRNQGAAWGMFQGRMGFFYVVTAFSLVLFYFLYKELDRKSFFVNLGLGMMIGGTFGNFIDRVTMGEVVDFLDFTIPVINYDFPIFNVADMGLSVGVTILIIIMLFDTIKEYKDGKI